jgi:osmotically inducible lipoprotein OsmB
MRFVTAIVILTLCAACTTTEQRVSGAAAGAGTGALIGGPIGAIAGGAIGAVSAPTVARAVR